MAKALEYYEIRIQGQLDSSWRAWFGGLTVTPLANGETLIAGSLPDQAALHGILTKLRDLNLPILAVIRVPGAPSR